MVLVLATTHLHITVHVLKDFQELIVRLTFGHVNLPLVLTTECVSKRISHHSNVYVNLVTKVIIARLSLIIAKVSHVITMHNVGQYCSILLVNA